MRALGMAVALVCLWLIDVSVALGTQWRAPAASLTNGFWEWPALQVYHAALWLLVIMVVVLAWRR